MPTWVKLAALAGVAAGLLLLGREAAGLLPRFGDLVRDLGIWGPLAFIAAYGAAATLMMPAVLLTLAAGALFGLGLGTLYAMLGATVGAVLAFLTGRYLARQFVARLLLRYPTLAAIDRAVERDGLRLVFLLRLSPAVPYTLLNYALSVSRVRFRDYLFGTLGMTPTVTMYVYSGKVAGDLASLAAGHTGPKGAAYYAPLGLGLLATIAVTIYATRLARRAIASAVDAEATERETTGR